MAKGTITFTDGDDGQVHVSIDFDPPIDLENIDDDASPAQACLCEKWVALSRLAESEATDE